MAWNNLQNAPIAPVSITEATLAALTVSNNYIIGRNGTLLPLGATAPSAATWAQLITAGADFGNGIYTTPLEADALAVAIQCSGLTTMAGTLLVTNLFSNTPLLAGYLIGTPGNPPTLGSGQAGVVSSAGLTLAAATNLYAQVPARVTAPSTNALTPFLLSRVWVPSISLTAVPTAGAFLNLELSWM